MPTGLRGARLALMTAAAGSGSARAAASAAYGGIFEGQVVRPVRTGPHPAVITEVAGEAYYTGEARFNVEEADPLAWGFRLRR